MNRLEYEVQKFMLSQMLLQLVAANPEPEPAEAMQNMQKEADRLVDTDKTKVMGMVSVTLERTGDENNPVMLHVHATGGELVIGTMLEALILDLQMTKAKINGELTGEAYKDPRDGTDQQCECEACVARRALLAEGAVEVAPGVVVQSTDNSTLDTDGVTKH